MRAVATWARPIIQVRVAGASQTVSYGATVEVAKGTRIATVAWAMPTVTLRASSNKSVAYLGGHRIRLIGRVTMDLLCFDVSNVRRTRRTKAPKSRCSAIRTASASTTSPGRPAPSATKC
ncbi:MAG: alanine racemase C-terminal domain-containing protein [Alphaproteobacteria bacterium]